MTDTRVREYGVKFDDEFIEAYCIRFDGCFVVFVKQSAPLNECLEHELTHVANGEI